MNNVRELLNSKGNQVWSVPPDTVVLDALQLMADKEVGALMVLDRGKLVGVFSERDYARKVRLKGKSSSETLVSELMVREVIYVSREVKIKECMGIMTAKRIRHLPVLEEGQLVGIVTIGDVVKSIISDQEFTISELEKYITGGY